jgi:hypothetical protein
MVGTAHAVLRWAVAPARARAKVPVSNGAGPVEWRGSSRRVTRAVNTTRGSVEGNPNRAQNFSGGARASSWIRRPVPWAQARRKLQRRQRHGWTPAWGLLCATEIDNVEALRMATRTSWIKVNPQHLCYGCMRNLGIFLISLVALIRGWIRWWRRSTNQIHMMSPPGKFPRVRAWRDLHELIDSPSSMFYPKSRTLTLAFDLIDF